ncbi:MAG: hypothetical protein K6T87_15505 [Roseiflexus sp.]|uniref:hypothetical protein n=1 Tax=Roseiflexus sp. TaxID=2562120 RepID=UPI0025EEC249|nr:hypothetical protein [Roseiflexus sp.]MCL6541963.1 hypothetical protein [Roseiflexus sp.]
MTIRASAALISTPVEKPIALSQERMTTVGADPRRVFCRGLLGLWFGLSLPGSVPLGLPVKDSHLRGSNCF